MRRGDDDDWEALDADALNLKQSYAWSKARVEGLHDLGRKCVRISIPALRTRPGCVHRSFHITLAASWTEGLHDSGGEGESMRACVQRRCFQQGRACVASSYTITKRSWVRSLHSLGGCAPATALPARPGPGFETTWKQSFRPCRFTNFLLPDPARPPPPPPPRQDEKPIQLYRLLGDLSIQSYSSKQVVIFANLFPKTVAFLFLFFGWSCIFERRKEICLLLYFLEYKVQELLIVSGISATRQLSLLGPETGQTRSNQPVFYIHKRCLGIDRLAASH